MTDRVVVHIGFRKTGTSSIQHFLRDHEQELLAPRGLRFPPGWLRLNNHVELPLALMRPDRMSTPRVRKDEWRDFRFRLDLVRQVRDDLVRHDGTTILSAEDLELLRYDVEMSTLAAVVGSGAHIVCTLRDPVSYRASLIDQLQKSGVGMSADPDAFNCVDEGSWLFDYDARLDVWRRHFTNVTTIDYDAAMRCYGSIIPAFMAVLGVPLHDLPTVTHTDDRYWLNPRGGREHRPDGNRWTNGCNFGIRPA